MKTKIFEERTGKENIFFLDIKSLGELKEVLNNVSTKVPENCSVYLAGVDKMAIIVDSGCLIFEDNNYAENMCEELCEEFNIED